MIAREIGQDTRFPAISLSDKDTKDGHGPGLSLSWSDKGHPIPGVTNPVDLYHQLFGQDKESAAEREFRLAERRSVLDGVVADLKSSKENLAKRIRTNLRNTCNRFARLNKASVAKWSGQIPPNLTPQSNNPKREWTDCRH